MTIYFIQCETGPIKIGYAKDIKKRFSNIQIHNPYKLTLLCAMPGNLIEEKELHKKFEHLKIRGEWFNPGDDLIKIINAQEFIGLTADGKPKLEKQGSWKGKNASLMSKRARIQRRISLRKCDECPKNGKCRIPKDGNYDNIDVNNYLVLCMKCSMKRDGRSENFSTTCSNRARTIKDPTPCIICSKLEKNLRKGRCHNCNEYFRRNGIERPLSFVKNTICINCKIDGKKLKTNKCDACYIYFKRYGIERPNTPLKRGRKPK